LGKAGRGRSMVIPSAKSVVLIPFPFSDLSNTKLRPALVLANAGRGDWILAQITSKKYSDLEAVELSRHHFSSGALRITSFVRPGKLFTANSSLIHSEVGRMKPDKFKEMIEVLVSMFRENIE